ncbi:MAG: 2-oxoglutarate oxidoreductase [Elusimicrobiota bacterium]|jgi:2-oxoglutarate ferredoxin oxidoreductase subunit beta|nr:2-oxoglutarate oxidoreductase [Elusimicrobiota bacterium]
MNYKHPKSLKNVKNTYCPGCGHGIIHRLFAEIVDELDIRENIIAVAPVGCAVFGYFYWDFDTTEAAHGRPPAVATALKRVMPDKIVTTYQGDGDLAAIGGNELLHTANRGENITIFFVNNSCYGMTGGQMAPTTLLGQKTTTTSTGRTTLDGYPIKVCELLSAIQAVAYIERTSLHSPEHIIKTKKAMKKALQNQIDEKGFSFVEILSMCPTAWKESPINSIKKIENEIQQEFKLGIYKDIL